jgi:hypothetical protein
VESLINGVISASRNNLTSFPVCNFISFVSFSYLTAVAKNLTLYGTDTLVLFLILEEMVSVFLHLLC